MMILLGGLIGGMIGIVASTMNVLSHGSEVKRCLETQISGYAPKIGRKNLPVPPKTRPEKYEAELAGPACCANQQD